MLVNPARYSPATAAVIVRAAPAKKRNTSAIAGNLVAQHRRERLAAVARFELGEGRASASMRSASFEQQRGAVLRRGPRPAIEGPGGGLHRGIHLRLGRLRQRGDALAGGRVQHLLARRPCRRTNLPLISSLVSMADLVRRRRLTLDVRPDHFVEPGSREIVGQEDRNQRHRDHRDGDHVGDRALARPEQLVEEPDRQRLLRGRR